MDRGSYRPGLPPHPGTSARGGPSGFLLSDVRRIQFRRYLLGRVSSGCSRVAAWRSAPARSDLGEPLFTAGVRPRAVLEGRCHDTVYSTTCGRIKKKSRGRPPILASLLPSLLRLEEKEGEKQAERRPGEHFFLFDHMWSNKRCHDTTRPLTPCTSQPSLEKEKAAKQTCSLSQWHCTRPQHASSRSILVPRAARRNDMRRTSLSKSHLDHLERSFQDGEVALVGPNLDPRDPRLSAVVQARVRGRCRGNRVD